MSVYYTVLWYSGARCAFRMFSSFLPLRFSLVLWFLVGVEREFLLTDIILSVEDL